MNDNKLLNIKYLLDRAVFSIQAISPAPYSAADKDSLLLHYEAWQEARERYFFELDSSGHEITDENLSDLQNHIEAMLGAAQAGDHAKFMVESLNALSALPGDPVIGPKRPKPKVKTLP